MLLGCHQAKPSPAIVEVLMPDDGSVFFDANRASVSNDGTEEWEATYSQGSQTAHFQFDLGPLTPLGKTQGLGFGHGKFTAVDGSQSGPLLLALKTALEAEHMPHSVVRAKNLTFDYADLGNDMSRSQDGSFSSKPPGNWRATKLFLAPLGADDDIEVFLNLNSAMKKGEFSIKDADYGDHVLLQLAKVL
jgi:hypothetical protein